MEFLQVLWLVILIEAGHPVCDMMLWFDVVSCDVMWSDQEEPPIHFDMIKHDRIDII